MNPWAEQLAAIDGFLAMDGGMPIEAEDKIIGMIDAGGALDGRFDEACAVKAIEKVQAKLN